MSNTEMGAPGSAEPSAPGAHEPCCSSHGVDMDCQRYRRTHFVEVRPCCSADSRLLEQETAKREAMLARRAEVIAEHPQLKTAGELAPFMGEHEREFWEWILDRLSQELSDAGLPPAEVRAAAFERGETA